jgi:mevalonate kinase
MTWSSFHTRLPGKWVLAGEHAVLRGATAVALPYAEAALELTFQPQVWEGLSIVPRDAEPVILDLLQAVRDEWEAEGRSFPMPRGTLQIESTIPVGAGLGSSAALCVALAQWLSQGLSIPNLFEFARRLEHRFHGKSSGMDVAVILAGSPIAFSMEKGARPLEVKRPPRFTLHDTGLRIRTSECVLRVERFREEKPMVAMKVDEAMAEAARFTMEGLISEDFQRIADGMKRARECFYSWELVPGAVHRVEEKLLAEGALATKLTGAGGGGFVVALWPKTNL